MPASSFVPANVTASSVIALASITKPSTVPSLLPSLQVITSFFAMALAKLRPSGCDGTCSHAR